MGDSVRGANKRDTVLYIYIIGVEVTLRFGLKLELVLLVWSYRATKI